MSNPIKGEITFEARETTFVFKLGTNAQAMIEEKVGKNFSQYLRDKGENLGAADIRMIFHAGLFRHHQMTEEDVGELIDELGSDRIAKIFVEAIAVASDQRKSNGADSSRPTKATKERIGMTS